MNIIKKITTITVLICFLASSVTGGYATGISSSGTASTATLATASKCSQLVGIEAKDTFRIEVMFQEKMLQFLPGLVR